MPDFAALNNEAKKKAADEKKAAAASTRDIGTLGIENPKKALQDAADIQKSMTSDAITDPNAPDLMETPVYGKTPEPLIPVIAPMEAPPAKPTSVVPILNDRAPEIIAKKAPTTSDMIKSILASRNTTTRTAPGSTESRIPGARSVSDSGETQTETVPGSTVQPGRESYNNFPELIKGAASWWDKNRGRIGDALQTWGMSAAGAPTGETQGDIRRRQAFEIEKQKQAAQQAQVLTAQAQEAARQLQQEQIKAFVEAAKVTQSNLIEAEKLKQQLSIKTLTETQKLSIQNRLAEIEAQRKADITKFGPQYEAQAKAYFIQAGAGAPNVLDYIRTGQ
jgi:hypothetical protein